MAKFEDQGYCPANALQRRAMQSENPTMEAALRGLGSRIQFMVYPNGYIPEGTALVLPLLETYLGRRAVGVLRDLIPECEYPDVGRKIEILDVEDFEELAWNVILITGDGFHVGFEEDGDTVMMRIMNKAS